MIKTADIYGIAEKVEIFIMPPLDTFILKVSVKKY